MYVFRRNDIAETLRNERMVNTMKRIIVDKENGKKWEIIKHGENDYTVNYYEFYSSRGWVHLFPQLDRNQHFTKDCIELEFGIIIA